MQSIKHDGPLLSPMVWVLHAAGHSKPQPADNAWRRQ